MFSIRPVPGKLRGDLLDHLFHLVIFQPGIDELELLAQNRQHHHFGEIFAIGVTRVLFVVQVDDLPVQTC